MKTFNKLERITTRASWSVALMLVGAFVLPANFASADAGTQQQTKLEDFGGPGAKVYYGRDFQSFLLRSCKVVIMGTENRPVTLVAVYDSDNVYSFWTHSPTFTSGQGGDVLTVTASDGMALVSELEGHRTTYSNLVEPGSRKGIAELFMQRDVSSKEVTRVDVNYYDNDRLQNRVSCRFLK